MNFTIAETTSISTGQVNQGYWFVSLMTLKIVNLHHWSCSKCQRITLFFLDGEIDEFLQGYDYGIRLRIMLSSMKINFPLHILTYTKGIFDTTTNSKRLGDFCLRNEIACIGGVRKYDKITNVAWIRFHENIANNFIRKNGNTIFSENICIAILTFTREQSDCTKRIFDRV